MTAKEFVLNFYPSARSERHVEGQIKGMSKPYYLIRIKGEHMYFSSGNTERNAWVNAKKKIQGK